MFGSLPDGLICLIRDFLAPIDFQRIPDTCASFHKCVTRESIIKSAGVEGDGCGFWPTDDCDLRIYLTGIRLGKICMPSATRLLRIVLHANESASMICCDFHPAAKAVYFSATRGLLLCSYSCQPKSRVFGELPSGVEELLNTHPQSAALVKWWKGRNILYTSPQPVHDPVTGELCGCPITLSDIDDMGRRMWTPEELKAVLPENNPLVMDRLDCALKYAEAYKQGKRGY
jgi:hypothetical protein